MFDGTQRHLTSQIAEMTQFRQEISASEKTNLSALGEISTALETALSQEREKADQERKKLTTEIVSMINAVLDGQYGRWASAVDTAKNDLVTSQTQVQGGYRLVSKGLDGWADREGAFSKKLLGNKEEVKKSIVEAAKVFQRFDYAKHRLLVNMVLLFRRVQKGFMHKPSSLSILR